MRKILFQTVLFAALGVALARATEPPTALNGWGPFRFGMSRDEIMRKMQDKVQQATRGQILLYKTDIDGTPFAAHLEFDNFLRLITITLEQSDAHDYDGSKCKMTMADLERKLGQKYGRPNVSQSPFQATTQQSSTQFIHSVWNFADCASIELVIVVPDPQGTFVPFRCALDINYVKLIPTPVTKETF